MFCIGKQFIVVFSGVIVNVQDGVFKVKGFKGELIVFYNMELIVCQDGDQLFVECFSDVQKYCVLYGLICILVVNVVKGVSDGYIINFELCGVGFCVKFMGKVLEMNIGYSYFVIIELFVGVIFVVFEFIWIDVSGIDKQFVGQVVVNVCKVCKFDVYYGKGVCFVGEQIVFKVGKVGVMGGKGKK